MKRSLLLAALAACGLVGSLGSASAGLLPSSWSVTPESGNYRWNYAIVLPTDSQLQSGNYFTIYDFNGFVPASNSQPEGWSFTTALVGKTPDGVLPQDDPNVMNLTWTYTGPDVTIGQTGLGNFWATSNSGNATDSFFTARTNRASDGKIDTNITTTSVPVPGEVVATPEPATLAMAFLGLPLIGLGRSRFFGKKN